jgi:hypothetical protein
MFASGKSPVEVHPEILDILLLRMVDVVYVDWGAGAGMKEYRRFFPFQNFLCNYGSWLMF